LERKTLRETDCLIRIASYWSKVAHTPDTLCVLENIADIEYMKQDFFSEAESQYVMTKTKINDLLKEGTRGRISKQ